MREDTPISVVWACIGCVFGWPADASTSRMVKRHDEAGRRARSGTRPMYASGVVEGGWGEMVEVTRFLLGLSNGRPWRGHGGGLWRTEVRGHGRGASRSPACYRESTWDETGHTTHSYWMSFQARFHVTGTLPIAARSILTGLVGLLSCFWPRVKRKFPTTVLEP